MAAVDAGPAPLGSIARVDRWLLSAAPPERLGVLRLVIGSYGLANFVVSVGEFRRLASRSGSQFEPVGIAGLLDGPVPAGALWALYALSLVTGAAFLAGAAYRISGPAFALCTLAWATYHSSWGQMLHFEHLLTLHLLVLGFSPAVDALSVDARRRSSPAPIRSVRYGWPVRLLAIITVVTYALAGLAKIRVSGWAWVDGTTLANHIAHATTRLDLLGEPRPPLATTVISQQWLIQPMALASLAIEVLAPLALFRRFRRLWVVGVVLFHVGTLATMFVFFAYNGLGIALLPLYRVERAAEWLRRRGQRPVNHSDGSTSLED